MVNIRICGLAPLEKNTRAGFVETKEHPAHKSVAGEKEKAAPRCICCNSSIAEGYI